MERTTALAIAGLWIGGHPTAMPAPLRDVFVDESGGLTAEATELVEDNYYRAVSEDDLIDSSLQGLTRGLRRRYDDRFSEYLSPSLLERFKEFPRTVLLGTTSFWEGVDVVGDALSVLVIAKLPFSVPTDPIFAARSEGFADPFNEYGVPQAILRFKQGFGRLIRSREDRGVVAVLDRRLLSKKYGQMFLDSLPHTTVRSGPAKQLPLLAARFLV